MEEQQPPKCLDKLAFNTQKEAWTAAIVARFQHGDVQLKAYKCRICDLWHLASNYIDK